MPNNGSRRGAVDMGMILMILSFVVIGGFLFWLRGQAAQEEELQAQAAAERAAQDTVPTVDAVSPAEIERDATPYEGQEIRLASVEVASLLGEQGFWLDMPGGNPFLVSLTSDLGVTGAEVTPGSPVTVVGTVVAMTDSILTDWVDSGSIAEGDRIVAEFATHFLQASEVRAGGGAGSSDAGNQEGGGGGSGD